MIPLSNDFHYSFSPIPTVIDDDDDIINNGIIYIIN